MDLAGKRMTTYPSRAMQQSQEGPIEVGTFVDESEREWEVREIREPLLPERAELLARPEFSGWWLLFSSGEERRRLAPLPPGWRQAPTSQLRRWCADASPARMRLI
jgi:hypothetical protein